MSWKEKVIIVAGVGSGLGSAVVSLLGGTGATVVGVARGSGALDSLTKVARARGWKFEGVQADLRRQADVDAAITVTAKRFGRLDGVSLNAGHWVQGDPLIHRTTDAEWSDGLVDNLDPVFRVCRAAVPPMLDRGGGSIVIVSASDRMRLGGNASYSVSKGGVIDLARKLAMDYRSFGIRFNAVLAGTMEHELDPARPPDESEHLPLRDQSGGGAWEVGRAIRYLLSDESRWVTGTTLTVDGGYSTRGKEQVS